MEQTRVFRMDGDELAVQFQRREEQEHAFGTYPDFATEPRYTPNGRPWVNVTIEGCPYVPQPYNDCGSCEYLQKEREHDLIGVCFHQKWREQDA